MVGTQNQIARTQDAKRKVLREESGEAREPDNGGPGVYAALGSTSYSEFCVTGTPLELCRAIPMRGPEGCKDGGSYIA